ncbi:MAG: transposase [Betaproteobacteria bacterium]|nr:transposase [Betaproteobacteria bacterium]
MFSLFLFVPTKESTVWHNAWNIIPWTPLLRPSWPTDWAARRAVLPSAPRQRCQFHFRQNAQAYVTRVDQRKRVAQRLRAIFNASDRA